MNDIPDKKVAFTKIHDDITNYRQELDLLDFKRSKYNTYSCIANYIGTVSYASSIGFLVIAIANNTYKPRNLLQIKVYRFPAFLMIAGMTASWFDEFFNKNISIIRHRSESIQNKITYLKDLEI